MEKIDFPNDCSTLESTFQRLSNFHTQHKVANTANSSFSKRIYIYIYIFFWFLFNFNGAFLYSTNSMEMPPGASITTTLYPVSLPWRLPPPLSAGPASPRDRAGDLRCHSVQSGQRRKRRSNPAPWEAPLRSASARSRLGVSSAPCRAAL